MSQISKGHLALISLGLLATASPFEGAAATQESTPGVSPAARWLQLAPPQRLAQRLDTSKLSTSPKFEKLDVPTKSKSNLTPPNPNKIDQTTNVKLVAVSDPKFGELK